jgi:thiol-disulfide isomerase/thioredoxin
MNLFVIALALAASLNPLFSATTWDNGRVTSQDLRNRVTVVDVFTVDCINCQNVITELHRLRREHGNDVAIVGVHSPETSWERQPAHRRAMLRTQDIAWPVAIDDNFRIWNDYGVTAWPTQLIFDRHGVLRKTVVGDSQDSLVESTVHALLLEH